MKDDNLLNKYYIGIVEDNNDPERKQRCKIRVPFLHGKNNEIPTDSLPWVRPEKDVDGTSVKIPQINKIVTVTFPTGSPYTGVYCEALHLDINLQNKIETYQTEDLVNFKAFCYDYNTQIYKDSEKLNIIYNNSGMIVDAAGNVITRLSDNNATYSIGDESANQAMILGNNFFNWMNQFMFNLTNGFICNGIPVLISPTMADVISDYKSMKTTFLSKNAFISDNKAIKDNKEDIISSNGDTFIMTNKELNINVEKINETNKVVSENFNQQEKAKEQAILDKENIEDELINEMISIQDETLIPNVDVPIELIQDKEETTYVYEPPVNTTNTNSTNTNTNSTNTNSDEDGLTSSVQDFNSDEEEWYNYDEFVPDTTYNKFVPDTTYNNNAGSSGQSDKIIYYNTKREPLDYSLIPNNKVSACLTLEMVTRTNSGTAAENLPDNNDHLRNLKIVAERYFDKPYKFFKKLGYELKITSAYRSTIINNRVGGAKSSQHKTGSALDLILVKDGKRYNNLLFYYFKYVMKHFGQLIWEGDCAKSGHKDGDNGPQWVHISLNNQGRKGQILKAAGGNFKPEHNNTIEILKNAGINIGTDNA